MVDFLDFPDGVRNNKPKDGDANLLFSQQFVENCMEIKENWRVPGVPLGSANEVDCKILNFLTEDGSGQIYDSYKIAQNTSKPM